MKKINIIIVDDHKIIRDGLTAIFMQIDNIVIKGEASNEAELINLLNKYSVDIIIMDISLPGKSGIDIAKELEEQNNQAKILILSSHVSPEIIDKALLAGVKGFLPKDSSTEDLVNALEVISRNGTYFTKEISDIITGKYIDRLNNQNNIINSSLSEREIEIIKLFAEGMSYKEIASELNLSVKTVDSHKRNIMGKLELNNNVDLIKYAIKNNITSI